MDLLEYLTESLEASRNSQAAEAYQTILEGGLRAVENYFVGLSRQDRSMEQPEHFEGEGRDFEETFRQVEREFSDRYPGGLADAEYTVAAQFPNGMAVFVPVDYWGHLSIKTSRFGAHTQ